MILLKAVIGGVLAVPAYCRFLLSAYVLVP
jgi:hypothetical protein